MMPAMDIVLSRASPRPLLHLLGRGAPEYRAQRLHHGYAGPAVSRRRRLLSAVAIQSSARQLSTGWGLWGILDAVQGRKMVGKDAHGNTYWEVANPGGKLDPYTKIPTDPKREIEYFENELENIEWHQVPPEWRLWLRYARKDKPTEEEIRRGEAQRAYTLARAKEIEDEDRRQRSLEMATGGVIRAEGQNYQERARLAYLADRVHGTSAGASGGAAADVQHNKSRNKQMGEATGHGETFQPGSWDPNL